VAIEVRIPARDELRPTFAAANVAFGEELRDHDFEQGARQIPLDRVLGAYDEGRPVGNAAAIPFELTVPGGALPCAGVTWVGVLPSHRRRGLLTQLMRRQLDDVHERGEPLAALYASEAVIYGRFGYGMAAPSYSVDAVDGAGGFRDDPGAAGTVRLVDADEALARLPEVYERARAERNGFLSRSPERWQGRVADAEHHRNGAGPKYFALAEVDGRPEAYSLYRIKHNWEASLPAGELRLVETVSASAAGTRELWRFLFGVDLVKKVTGWPVDPHELFLMVRDPRRLAVRVYDGLWLRLVDVGEALRRRAYAAAGSVVLDVRDDFCPWNTARFRAGEDAGPTDDEPELSLGVADLASAYLGGFGFEGLHAAERVEELAPGAVARAAALFRTPRPPFCPEEF
jgi:predicted acetyltransferase